LLNEENGKFPLTESRFREVLTVENMVRSSNAEVIFGAWLSGL